MTVGFPVLGTVDKYWYDVMEPATPVSQSMRWYSVTCFVSQRRVRMTWRGGGGVGEGRVREGGI